jgi:methylated-DNA-[protein]-cysteine S-methyltransferase
MQYYTAIPTPFGAAGLVATEKGLSHVLLTAKDVEATLAMLRRKFPEAEARRNALGELRRQLKAYFAGERVRFREKPDLNGLTAFQRDVLAECARVPAGRTVTYGELARRIGRPGAARAVGGALAHNPVPLVIPCHRVVAGNGKLGGFSAEQGVSLKRRLLELERSGR